MPREPIEDHELADELEAADYEWHGPFGREKHRILPPGLFDRILSRLRRPSPVAESTPTDATAVEAEREGVWQSLGTAPKDGTLVELVVDYTDGDHPLEDATLACTIGFNNLKNDGEDTWKFAGWCWTHDHFTEGKGLVVAWRPSRLCASDDGLPSLPPRTKES